jgi:hypothetical protein
LFHVGGDAVVLKIGKFGLSLAFCASLVACGGGSDTQPVATGVDLDLASKENSSNALNLISRLLALNPNAQTLISAINSESKSFSSAKCPGSGNTLIIVSNPDGNLSVGVNPDGTPSYDSFEVKNIECVLSDTLDSRSPLKSMVSGSTVTLLTEISGYTGEAGVNYSVGMKTNSSQSETFSKFVTPLPFEVSVSGGVETKFTSQTSITHAIIDPEYPEEALVTETSKTLISSIGQLNGSAISGRGTLESQCVRSPDGSALCDKFDIAWSGTYANVTATDKQTEALVSTGSLNLIVRVKTPLRLNEAGTPIEGELSISQGSNKIIATFSKDGVVPKVTITTGAKASVLNFSDLEELSKKFRF